MVTKIFPQFLNEGSQGGAVVVLQLLIMAKEGPTTQVRANGDYAVGGPVGDWVESLQRRHGLDPDRHFGPLTRKAFFEETGIDVNTIELGQLAGDTYVAVK